MLQQRLEGMGQNLVRAVADEHLLGRDVVAGRDRLAQARRARIGIEPQPIRRPAAIAASTRGEGA